MLQSIGGRDKKGSPQDNSWMSPHPLTFLAGAVVSSPHSLYRVLKATSSASLSNNNKKNQWNPNTDPRKSYTIQQRKTFENFQQFQTNCVVFHLLSWRWVWAKQDSSQSIIFSGETTKSPPPKKCLEENNQVWAWCVCVCVLTFKPLMISNNDLFSINKHWSQPRGNSYHHPSSSSGLYTSSIFKFTPKKWTKQNHVIPLFSDLFLEDLPKIFAQHQGDALTALQKDGTKAGSP